MHLYIRTDDFQLELPDIQLKDGYIPAIGASSTTDDPSFPRIEPAVWFKVFVLDSISIDCTTRTIKWNSGPVDMEDDTKTDTLGQSASMSLLGSILETSKVKKKRISESMYIGGECNGYHNDLDELFELAQSSLCGYAKTEKSQNQFYLEVLQLLHLYVLPNITLNSDDLQKVNEAFETMDQYISDADTKIMRLSEMIGALNRDMKKQRNAFVEEMTTNQIVHKYPTKLQNILHSQIENDLEDSWAKINSLQGKIDDLKRRDEGNEDATKELSSARTKREIHLKLHEKLLVARETLHAMSNGHLKARKFSFKSVRGTIKAKISKSKPPVIPLHGVYIGMYEQLKTFENNMTDVADDKVLMTSVKEALRNAKRELSKGGETLGVETDRGRGQKETDVLRRSTIPREWYTLHEQVFHTLTSESHPIFILHSKFCVDISERCKATLEEHKTFEEEMSARDSTGSSDRSSSVRFSIASTNSAEEMTLLRTRYTDVSKTIYKSSTINMNKHSEPANKNPLFGSRNMNFYDYKSSCETLNTFVMAQGPCDTIIVREKHKDYLMKSIESLKRDIHLHFENMCQKLLRELHRNANQDYSKVWLCYESYFFELTIALISSLYCAAYAATVQGLTEAIPNITTEDLDIGVSIVAYMLSDKDTNSPKKSESDQTTSDYTNDTCVSEVHVQKNMQVTVENIASRPRVRIHDSLANMSKAVSGLNTDGLLSSFCTIENTTSPISDSDKLAFGDVELRVFNEKGQRIESSDSVDGITKMQKHSNKHVEFEVSYDESQTSETSSQGEDVGAQALKSDDIPIETQSVNSSDENNTEGGDGDSLTTEANAENIIEEVKKYERVQINVTEVATSSIEALDLNEKDVPAVVLRKHDEHHDDEVFHNDGLQVDTTDDGVDSGVDFDTMYSPFSDSVLSNRCSRRGMLLSSVELPFQVDPIAEEGDFVSKSVVSSNSTVGTQTDIPMSDEKCASCGSQDLKSSDENVQNVQNSGVDTKKGDFTDSGQIERQVSHKSVLEMKIMPDRSISKSESHADPEDDIFSPQSLTITDPFKSEEDQKRNSCPGQYESQAQSIKVYTPKRVTVLYDKAAWPNSPLEKIYDDSVEQAVEAREKVNRVSPKRDRASAKVKSVCFTPEFKQRFKVAIDCLKAAVDESSPLLKLQNLTKCLRELNKQISRVQREQNRGLMGANSDDLIDVLVLLLCNCDVHLTASLYPNLMLLTDYIAPFLEGGPYSFSLVQFTVAFQHVWTNVIKKQWIADNQAERQYHMENISTC